MHESDRLIREYKSYVQADLLERNAELKALIFTDYKFSFFSQTLHYKSNTYRMHEPQPEQILLEMPPTTNEIPSDDSVLRVKLSSNGQYKIDILDEQYKYE